MKNGIYFISGIDTDAGKSFATGFLARELMNEGKNVITQKLIQTGNSNLSEDILLHRRLMQIGLTPEDESRITMPEIYSYPCSPHLAAKIDNRPINFNHIDACTQQLVQKYDIVLLEGAGGLMVPLTDELLTIDYLAQRGYPLIFVTSGKLGSINHTLLSLEAIRSRRIELHTVLYNSYPHDDDPTIREDTKQYISNHLTRNFPRTNMLTVPLL